MSAFFNHNQVSVKSIGKTVLIPDNDIARLMYYLSCVDTVINYGEDILSDYENYDLLTPTQKEVLVKLVEMFAPPFFIKAGVFILDQNLLPGNFNNEFYQITDQRIGIHINQEIMIGGRTVRVLKIMACNTAWLNKYYYTPLKNIYYMKEFMNFFSRALLDSLKNYNNDYDNSFDDKNNNNYDDNNNSNYDDNNDNIIYNNNNNYNNNYNYNNNNKNEKNIKRKRDNDSCCLIW